MSENMEFKLSLDNKSFTASINSAGKLLKAFGDGAKTSAKSIAVSERAMNSLSRTFRVLNKQLLDGEKVAQDMAAGFQLMAERGKNAQVQVVGLNANLKTLQTRLEGVERTLDKTTGAISVFVNRAHLAGLAAKNMGLNAKQSSDGFSSLNIHLSRTNHMLQSWKGSTSTAVGGLKAINNQLREIANREAQITRTPFRVSTSPVSGSNRKVGRNDGNGRSINSSGEHNSSTFNGLVGKVSGTAQTAKDIFISWQQPIIEAAAQMQKIQILLEGVNKSAADPKAAARQDMDYIVNMAKTAPFSMGALTDAFVRFKSVGLDPTDGSMKSLIDSVVRFGGDSALLKRSATAIQQMSANGVISMEGLRQQLGEAVPTAMQAMANASGVTLAELTKQISTGTVEAESALKLLFIGLEAQNKGAANDLMVTYTSALTQLQTSFTLFADNIGKSGSLESMTNVFRDLTNYMNSVDGQKMALNIGENLSSAIESLRTMAKFVGDNIGLFKTLAEIIVAGLGFSLLKKGILGTAGAAMDMGRAVKNGFSMINSASVAAVSTVGRISKLISEFGAKATLIIGVGEAIKMVRAAWLSFTAVIIANPVGAAIAAIGVAIAGLISIMTMLRDKTEETVTEIRKIPAAMTAAQRAQVKGRINSLSGNIAEDERILRAMGNRDSYVENYGLGARVHSRKAVEERIAANKTQRDIYTETIGMGDKAVYEQLAADVIKNRLDKIDVGIAAGLAQYDNTTAKKAAAERVVLSNSKLSPLEKEKEIARINDNDRAENLKPYTAAINATTKHVDSLAAEVTKLTEQLKDPKLNTDERSRKQGQLDGQAKAYVIAKNKLEELQSTANNISQSRFGTPFTTGKKSTGFGMDPKLDEKMSKLYLSSLTDSGGKPRINASGKVMTDLTGDMITGDSQLKVDQEIREIYSGVTRLDQLTAEQQKQVSETLANAKIKDAERAADAAVSASNKETAAIRKTGAEQLELVEGYRKALDKGAQLTRQMGFSTEATATFDQQINDVTQSLTKLANATPTSLITPEMIEQANAQLSFIQDNAKDLRDRFNRDTVNQNIQKFAPFTENVISAGYTPSREEKGREFNENFNRSLSYLQGEANKTQDEDMAKLYEQKITQMLAARNKAFIQSAGTASQNLAVQYADVASQVEKAWAGTFESLTDHLVDFVKTGKFNMTSFADYITNQMLQIAVKSMVVEPLMGALGMGANPNGQGPGPLSNLMNGFMEGTTGANVSNQSLMETVPGAPQDDSLGGVKAPVKSLTSSMMDLASSGVDRLKAGFAALTSSFDFSSMAAEKNATTTNEATKSTWMFSNTATAAITAVGATIASLGAATGNKWMGYLGAAVSVVGMASSAYNAMSSAGWLSSGGGNAVADGTKGIQLRPTPDQFQVITPHANGGVFGPGGVVSLAKYSKGGIATSPQLALFGEGDMNEAYVPLPDGRTIPVTMTGNASGSGGDQVNIAITVQNYNDGSSNSSGDGDNGSQWNEMARKVKAVVLDTLTSESRPGGMLNNTAR
ncbi:tape measure protein [Photorhabdus asymbiotica]|uniref:tape measure protein n=2 Tax=Photorhabdus asymbiotica TaxID=291112 RepID=UPI003DA794FA